MLDGMAITKADGDNKLKAERARTEYMHALHLFPASADGWIPPVLTCSSLTGEGLAETWQMVLDHGQLMESNGFLAERRSSQALEWMNELLLAGIEDSFRKDTKVAERLPLLREEVRRGSITPFAASRDLLRVYLS
jgi:LAO/AO transport system kinase